MKCLVLVFYFLCSCYVSFSAPVDGYEETCSPSCFTTVHPKLKKNCDENKEKSKNEAGLFYNYDVKSGICKASYCFKNPAEVFDEERLCTASCKTCQTLLKYYKADDECLQGPLIALEPKDKDVPPLSKNLWSFDTRSAKCLNYGQNLTTEKYKFSVFGGLILPTEDECIKRCPSLPK